MPLVKKPRAWRFKLRTILLAVSLAVLILPLGGVYVFRFYEGELVKQTEVELIAQAAMIAAVIQARSRDFANARRQRCGVWLLKSRWPRIKTSTFDR